MPKDKEKTGHGTYTDYGNVRFGSSNPEDSAFHIDTPRTYRQKKDTILKRAKKSGLGPEYKGLRKLKSKGIHHSAADGKFIDERRKL